MSTNLSVGMSLNTALHSGTSMYYNYITSNTHQRINYPKTTLCTNTQLNKGTKCPSLKCTVFFNFIPKNCSVPNLYFQKLATLTFGHIVRYIWQHCFYLLVEFPSGCNRRTLTELCVGKSIFIIGINPFSRWILRSTSISYNHFTIIFMARFAFFTIQ